MQQHSKLSSPFLIGLFVISGTVVMIGVIIWLGASQFLKETQKYVTYFDGSVEGLETGSPVKYQGVPVGSVSKIEVAPDGKLIEVIMQIDSKIKIDDKLRVKAEMMGIAGGKFLQLHYPSDTTIAKLSPLLTFTPPFQLINSTPSGIQEIEAAARDVLDKLSQFRYKDVSEEMVTFFRKSSEFFSNEELYKIISELKSSAEKLSSILGKADTSRVIANLEETTQKLIQTAGKLENFADTLNFQLKVLNLPSKVDHVIAQYDSAMQNTSTIMSVLGIRMEAVIYRFDETLEGLRATNNQLRRTIRAYTENPGQLLLSEPPPEEK